MLTEVFIGLIIVGIILYLFKTKEREPPGEFGWPVIGSLPSSSVRFQDYVDKYRAKYGDIFSWKMGNRHFVFICDYKLIKTAFAHPALQARPDIFTFRLFSDGKPLGVTGNNGENWQTLRRFVTRQLRDQGMGKSIINSSIEGEAEKLVKEFEKLATGEPVEIPFTLNVAIINIMWKLTTNVSVELNDPIILNLQKMLNKSLTLVQMKSLLLFDLFPWLVTIVPTFIKNWMGLKFFNEEYSKLIRYLKQTIDEHKLKLDVNDPKDFIDEFLIEIKKSEEGKGTEKSSCMNEDELLYVLMDIFFNSSETTAATIRWTLLYMAKYPDIQKKAQDQLDSIVSRHELPTVQERKRLPFIDAISHEIMRKNTLTPNGIYHSADEDTMIGDYKIKKDSIICSSFACCHMDPKYWDNPNEFLPERFLLPDGSFDGRKDGFLPFSVGRRACTGESFAKTNLFVFIACLLHRFTFEEVESEPLSTEPELDQPLFWIPTPYKIRIKERK